MFLPQANTPVNYLSGRGQVTTHLLPLGKVKADRQEMKHSLMQKEEVFTDNAMSDLMNDNFLGEEVGNHDDGEEGPDLEDLLGDESPLQERH